LKSFPLVAAAVAIVFNLPELSTHVIAGGTLRLERETLASIFSGDIEWWDDPALVDSNSDLPVPLPHQQIKVAYRSDGSGTTDIFTSALTSMSTTWRDKYGSISSWPEELQNRTNILPGR